MKHFKNNQEYLKEVYEYHPDTHSLTIPISIDRFSSVFNSLDSSPIKIRDLSPDFTSFLQDSSDEIPLSYQIKISIQVEQELRDPTMEIETLQGIRHYFRYLILKENAKVRRTRQKTIKYVLFFIVFIASVILSSKTLPENLLTDLFKEGLTVGGWIFLWQTFDINFIQMDSIRDRIIHLKRLSEAEFIFHYPLTDPNNSIFVQKENEISKSENDILIA